MWEIYDQIICEIPEDLIVNEVIVGTSWTMVRAGTSVGVAMTINETTAPSILKYPFIDEPLKNVAAAVKSWNFIEASIGLAAINAYYNSKEHIMENAMKFCPQKEWHISNEDVFDSYSETINGKKIAVVGHFPYLEKRLGTNNQLSILERNPKYGDYPDTACEYLLSQQDYVFITGSAFVNKTMPRLLQLSKNAKVILVGPSVPITSLLFNYGVFELSGFVVTNQSLCRKVISEGNITPLFVSGQRVCLHKNLEEE